MTTPTETYTDLFGVVDFRYPAYMDGRLDGFFPVQPLLALATPTTAVFRPPVANANELIFQGTFAYAGDQILPTSTITGIEVRTSTGELIAGAFDFPALSAGVVQAQTGLVPFSFLWAGVADDVVTNGNAVAGVIEGRTGNDTLNGGGGNDGLHGGEGDDSLAGDAGGDYLFGEDGNDIVSAGDGNDLVTGGNGFDILEGGAGGNALLGGSDVDILLGGAGGDWYQVFAEPLPLPDGAVVDLGTGAPGARLVGRFGGGGGVPIGMEAGSATVTRLDRDADTVIDGVRVEFSGTALPLWSFEFSTFALGAPFGPGSYLDAMRIGSESAGRPGMLVAIGAAPAAVSGGFEVRAFGAPGELISIAFDQTDATSGSMLTGVVYVSQFAGALDPRSEDVVHERPGGGIDAVYSDFSYRLPAEVEMLVLARNEQAYTVNGTGNSLANTLIGFLGANYLSGLEGDDTLDGGGGADTLDGGAGNDFYRIHDAGVTVIDTGGAADYVQASFEYRLGDGIEILQITGSAPWAIGNALDNMLIGNASANTLWGLEGSDTIGGGESNDTLWGDVGQDSLHGESGDDVIFGGGDYDLVFGGEGVDLIMGEDGGDILFGESGNDMVDGGAGTDILHGQEGIDILFGDAADDQLIGGDGDDALYGERDTGGTSGGNDWIYGDTELLSLTGGNDSLYGDGGNDVIIGGGGDDLIVGGHGNDIVEANAGADVLVGSDASLFGAASTGSDLFIYRAMTDAGDTIHGFDIRAGNNDGIDLRPLFDALGYAGTTARADGYLRITQSGSDAWVEIDADGAGGAEQFVTMITLVDRAPGDIIDGFFLFQ